MPWYGSAIAKKNRATPHSLQGSALDRAIIMLNALVEWHQLWANSYRPTATLEY